MIKEKAKCLLCNSEAEFISCDHDDKKDFNCPVCKRYIVDVAAESELKEMSRDCLEVLRFFVQKTPDKEKAGFMVDVIDGGKQITPKYYDIDWGL